MAGFSGDGDKPRAHLRWARHPAQVQGVQPAGHDRYRQALGVCRVIFLAKVAEIPDGARKLIQVNGISVALFRHEGQFYALNNACPHRQGPLIRGVLESWGEGPVCAVRCPMHGWKFDLATGDSHGRPENATVYPLILQDDALYIEI